MNEHYQWLGCKYVDSGACVFVARTRKITLGVTLTALGVERFTGTTYKHAQLRKYYFVCGIKQFTIFSCFWYI